MTLTLARLVLELVDELVAEGVGGLALGDVPVGPAVPGELPVFVETGHRVGQDADLCPVPGG